MSILFFSDLQRVVNIIKWNQMFMCFFLYHNRNSIIMIKANISLRYNFENKIPYYFHFDERIFFFKILCIIFFPKIIHKSFSQKFYKNLFPNNFTKIFFQKIIHNLFPKKIYINFFQKIIQTFFFFFNYA